VERGLLEAAPSVFTGRRAPAESWSWRPRSPRWRASSRAKPDPHEGLRGVRQAN